MNARSRITFWIRHITGAKSNFLRVMAYPITFSLSQMNFIQSIQCQWQIRDGAPTPGGSPALYFAQFLKQIRERGQQGGCVAWPGVPLRLNVT